MCHEASRIGGGDRPRRRGRALAVTLVAGLVFASMLTYALAWWCAASYEAPVGPGWTRVSRGDAPTAREQACWSGRRPPGVTGKPGMITVLSGRGRTLTLVQYRTPTGSNGRVAFDLRAGWPVPCVRGTIWDSSTPAPAAITLADGMLVIPHGTSKTRQTTHLPLVPVPVPFAISAMVWLAMTLGGFAAIGASRRTLRRARGRCTVCAYPMRPSASPRCPECGALDHRATA